jgi:uncharacterized membrane protein
MSAMSGHSPAEDRVEQLVGNLLRIGVLAAALVALLGGIVYLFRHGTSVADYRAFRGQPEVLSSLGGIVTGALALQSEAIVQLGIVLLIATPIARVFLTLVTFAVRRDWMYVVVSAIVLGFLAYGLLGGKV